MCAVAFVEKEAFIDPGDPHERQRADRRRLLEQRVAETLALKPSKPCPLLKGNEHGSYKLSPDEEEREIRNYLRRSRQVRIMQVRAQEMLLAAQRVGHFRQRKKNEKQKLLQVLKEAWQEEHNRRIADVEENLVTSCKGIGQSHNAAQEVITNMAAMAEEKVKQAEENRLWETLRYQKAKQEECARKLETVEVEKLAAAKDRRRVVECAAEIERTRARCRASQAKFKSMEEKRNASEEDAQKYLQPHFNSNDVKQNFIQSRLAGTPNDYKDTYFHSRFCVLKDKTNLNNNTDHGAHEHAEQNDGERGDAWEAAEAHLKKFELEQQQRADVEEFWNKRKMERGQQAVAHLQKIASLEEELAREVEQEQERKHQLQLIEELSMAARASAYKSKQNHDKAVDEQTAPSKAGNCDSNATDCSGPSSQADAADPVETESTQPAQQIEKGTTRTLETLEQLSMTAQDDAPDASRKNENSHGKDDECDGGKDAEIVDIRIDALETSTKPFTSAKVVKNSSDTKINPSSPRTALNGDQLSGKTVVNEGKTVVHPEPTGPSTNVDPNTPGRTPKAQSARVTPRAQKCAPPTPQAQKCATPTPQVSHLPNFYTTNNIRKGNKSPQRLNSPERVVTHGLENPGAVDHVKEVGSRPRGRQAAAVPNTRAAAAEKKSAVPAAARKMEICTSAEGKKMTPRKHKGTWLANVLEKLTWWKSQKGLAKASRPLDSPVTENLSIPSGQPPKPFNRDARKEWPSKAPVKQVDPPAKCRTLNRSLPARSKISEQPNSLPPSQMEADIASGWYEAYTKDVFSEEELDALQLELYGTWTDGNASIITNKGKPKRDKVKPGQQGNDSDILNQQGCNLKRKGESREKVAGDSISNRITKDSEVAELDGGKFNIEHVTGAKPSNKLLERTPGEQVPCEPPAVRDDEPEHHKREFVRDDDRRPISSSPSLPEGSRRADIQSAVEIQGSNSDRLMIKSECEGPQEPISARDVAEKLIQAWQTGQLGGAPSPMSGHSKQSRKRRARTDEPHTDCSGPGMRRRKGITRAQQTSSKKVGKWEIPIARPQSSTPQEKRLANNANGVVSQTPAEKSRNLRATPTSPSNFTAHHSPSQLKTEAFQSNGVYDTAPEARSLDFILGSLSAQVKELDERLRNVTSCATFSAFPDECCQDGEQIHAPTFQEAMAAPSAGKTSQITDRGNLGAKKGSGSDCQTPGTCAIVDQEKSSPRARSVKSPRMRGIMALKGDFSVNVKSQTTGSSTCRSGDQSQPVPEEELPPMTSMASCLENISDLMKEMSRSTSACEKLAPQTPTHPDVGAKSGRSELALSDDDDKDSVCTEGSEQDLLARSTPKSCKAASAVPTRLSLKSSAELCSAVIHRRSDAGPQCPISLERASLSTLNLEEAMSLDELEEQLLLSGSVDFSPWNTEKLPDVFSSIANVAKSVNYSAEQDDEGTDWDGGVVPDVDCEGTLRPVYCHVKKESEWLLRGNKLRGKSKAYERRKAWKARGKQKKSPKKAFNPIALPPRHSTPRKHSSTPTSRRPATATVLAKVSTTRIQPSSVPLPGVLRFQRRELKPANDGSSKLNLTTRSLPTQFPASVSAEEVQKWLRREAAVSCSAVSPIGVSPIGTPAREGAAPSVITRHQFTGYKKTDILESVAGQQQVKLMAPSPVRIPDLAGGLRDSTYRKKAAAVQPLLESRRRPASAGTVWKRYSS